MYIRPPLSTSMLKLQADKASGRHRSSSPSVSVESIIENSVLSNATHPWRYVQLFLFLTRLNQTLAVTQVFWGARGALATL